LGRLALLDNIDRVRRSLREQLAAVVDTSRQTVETLPRVNEPPSVVVVASIGGGTGSGILVDLVHLIRAELEVLDLPNNAISLVLLHATSPKPAEKEIARANGYATLLELNRLLRPSEGFVGEPLMGLESRKPQGEIVRDCYVVHLGEDLNREAAQLSTDVVAEYLTLDAATEWRGLLSSQREAEPDLVDGEPTFRSLGLFRIRFRRQELAFQVARTCARQLMARWHGDLDTPQQVEEDDSNAGASLVYRSRWLKDLGEAEAMHILGKLQLDESKFLASFEDTMTTSLDRRPEQLKQETLTRALSDPNRDPGQAAAEVIRELDPLLGIGPMPNESQQPLKSPFEKRSLEQSRQRAGEECQTLEKLIGELVDHPERRVKPALVAIDEVVHHLLTLIESKQQSLIAARDERLGLRGRLLREPGAAGGRRFFGARGLSMSELAELAGQYIKTRLREVAIANVIEFIRTVYRRATEIRQRLIETRQRCSQLADHFLLRVEVGPSPTQQGSTVNGLDLLPGQSSSILEASTTIARHLAGTSFFEDLEERLGEVVLKDSGGLWGLVRGESGAFERTMETRLLGVVLDAVLVSMETIDSASLFFDMCQGVTEAVRELKKILEKSRPRLMVAGGKPQLILSVPNSPPGRSLRELVASHMPPGTTLPVVNHGDVIFCYEASRLPISRVAEEIIGHEPAFIQAGSRLVTRVDDPPKPLAHK
jgi:hypothetical protein